MIKNITLTTGIYLPTVKRNIMDVVLSNNVENAVEDKDKARHFIEDVLGKTVRYEMDPTYENSLDMAVKASESCLKKANVDAKDIDLIICTSIMPEMYAPASSIALHKRLKGGQQAMCKDVNVNCLGMLLEFIHAQLIMAASNKVKKCLLVHSEYFKPILQREFLLPNTMSDSATAVLLEVNEGKTEPSLLDYSIYTNSEQADIIRGPVNGAAKYFNNPHNEDYRVFFGNADVEEGQVCKMIQDILQNNNLVLDDIKGFFFSQYVLANTIFIKSTLNIPEEKIHYIGHKYGYTGASSPFVALHDAFTENKIKRGDLCLFWTIGAGTEHALALFRL